MYIFDCSCDACNRLLSSLHMHYCETEALRIQVIIISNVLLIRSYVCLYVRNRPDSVVGCGHKIPLILNVLMSNCNLHDVYLH